MALKNYQSSLQLGRLYEASKAEPGKAGTSQLLENLFIDSGSVDVYGSNSATQPTALSEMILNTNNTNVSGIIPFEIIPRYIAVVQNTGSTTELVASGVRVEDLGAIS